MSRGLTWYQARALAINSTPVRRAGWTDHWLHYDISLWWINRHEADERVVHSADFGKAEFFANDWTDELFSDSDPCQKPPYSINFIPPALTLTGVITAGAITDALTLTAAIGDGTPDGIYSLTFLVNGNVVGIVEAPTPGQYSVTTAPPAGALFAQVIANSTLPLPVWQGSASWTPNETYIVANVFGSSGTFYSGTFERFRLLADGDEIWSLDGLTYPNWVGDTNANEPFSVPSAIVKVPLGTAVVEMWLQENSNGYPTLPQSLTPPFVSVTNGSSWYYKVVFSGKTVATHQDQHNTFGFRYSPQAPDPYWAATGTTGVDTMVISQTIKP